MNTRATCGWMKALVVLPVAAGASFSWGQCASESTTLFPERTQESLFIGRVQVVGDTAFLGTPYYDADSGGQDVGAVYTFERQGDEWVETDIILSSTQVEAGYFGTIYDYFDSNLIVSALTEEDGTAYIFETQGNGWIEVARLQEVGDNERTQFGHSVAMGTDEAFVGMPTARLRLFGNRPSGAVRQYIHSPDGWIPWRLLSPAEPIIGSDFGRSMDLSGDILVVGAPEEERNNPREGAVYVFERSGDSWIQTAKLELPDAMGHERFGLTVAVDGDRIAVGADGADGFLGAVYVFEKWNGQWIQWAKLSSPTPHLSYYGRSIVLENNRILVGQPVETINGHEGAGVAFLYERAAGGTWQLIDTVTPSIPTSLDFFGDQVALGGSDLFIGAFGVDIAGVSSVGSVFVMDGGACVSCPPDFNADGSVNTLDFLDFLNAFNANDPHADFNEDESINTLDLLSFLNAFQAGC